MTDMILTVVHDENGLISSIDFQDAALAHIELGDAFLEHFGVLGMHWGHRKGPGAGTSHPGLDKPLHKNYTKQELANDKRYSDQASINRINNRLHAGVSNAIARNRERSIRTQAHAETSLTRAGTAAIAGGVAAGTTANLTLRAARAVAWSPATTKALNTVFGGAPFGAKVVLANAVIGARLATDVANSPLVRRGIIAASVYEGAKAAGSHQYKKDFQKNAAKEASIRGK